MARYTGPITKKSRRLKVDLVGDDTETGSAPRLGDRLPHLGAGRLRLLLAVGRALLHAGQLALCWV